MHNAFVGVFRFSTHLYRWERFTQTLRGSDTDMAKLETLTKEQYDALSDELKEYYKVNQEGKYDLDGIGELKRAVQAEKDKKDAAIKAAVDKAVVDALKPFEGLDVDVAKQAIADKQKIEDEKLTAAGDIEAIRKQFDERVKTLEDKAKADVEAIANEKNGLLATLHGEKLANFLTEQGVLPDRVKYLVGELQAQTELVNDEHGFSLKKAGSAIGDATELDAIIETVKAKTPFFFAGDNATGSGASGSNGNGSSGAKTWNRSQWDAASTSERSKFASAGGQVTD